MAAYHTVLLGRGIGLLVGGGQRRRGAQDLFSPVPDLWADLSMARPDTYDILACRYNLQTEHLR